MIYTKDLREIGTKHTSMSPINSTASSVSFL